MVIRRKSKVKHTAKKPAVKKRQPKRRAARPCTCAPACKQALTDATARWPQRNRASDGCCGDAAHAARVSDHNPNARGFATAFDLTNDPVNGPDINAWLYLLSADPRIKYMIFNHRIWKPDDLGWRPYHGANGHEKHLHISIYSKSTHDLRPWPWSVASARLTLRRGDRGPAVEELQRKLNERGYKLTVDGSFGGKTEAAVRDFQEGKGLTADAIVGRATWAALDQQA